jgi:hypothetical protein
MVYRLKVNIWSDTKKAAAAASGQLQLDILRANTKQTRFQSSAIRRYVS